MIFEQHYLECLSQASYLIGDSTTNTAVVVDPRRDISEYLRSAEDQGLRIVMIIETHYHADFLSGHLELAAATGAEIAYGSVADPEFAHRKLTDGEVISLGEVALEILHTPGHTPESISIVVREHSADDVPYGVLTGDTLFIGDVGRPDLLSSVGVSSDELGRSLFSSLRDRLMPLPDDTKVFPGHGAGSACGKSLSTETVSTIGAQRRSNYALAEMDVDEFVAVVTEGQSAAPAYFSHDAELNRTTHAVYDETTALTQLGMEEVLAARERGAVLLDTRDQWSFSTGHLIGSLNTGLEGRFAEYAGVVAGPDDELVIIADPGTEQESRTRLARIGFDNVIGYLTDPYESMTAHPERVERSSRITIQELMDRQEALDTLVILDVRNPSETSTGSIAGAELVPLSGLRARLDALADHRDHPMVVMCAGGYRSSLAASVLRAEGFTDVSDLLGGYQAVTGVA